LASRLRREKHAHFLWLAGYLVLVLAMVLLILNSTLISVHYGCSLTIYRSGGPRHVVQRCSLRRGSRPLPREIVAECAAWLIIIHHTVYIPGQTGIVYKLLLLPFAREASLAQLEA